MWFALHLFLLIILLNHQDNNPVVLGFSAPYAALLGLIIATGLLGGIFLTKRRSVNMPRALLNLRSNASLRPVGLVLGTVVLTAIWTTPFQNITLSSLQSETIRGWATLATLAIVYFALFYQSKSVTLPWAAWLAVAVIIGAAVVILAVHFLARFPQLNLIDELHNWSVSVSLVIHSGRLALRECF